MMRAVEPCHMLRRADVVTVPATATTVTTPPVVIFEIEPSELIETKKPPEEHAVIRAHDDRPVALHGDDAVPRVIHLGLELPNRRVEPRARLVHGGPAEGEGLIDCHRRRAPCPCARSAQSRSSLGTS